MDLTLIQMYYMILSCPVLKVWTGESKYKVTVRDQSVVPAVDKFNLLLKSK